MILEELKSSKARELYSEGDIPKFGRSIVESFNDPKLKVELLSDEPAAIQAVVDSLVTLKSKGLDEVKVGKYRDIQLNFLKRAMTKGIDNAKEFYKDSINRGTIDPNGLLAELELDKPLSQLLEHGVKNNIEVNGIAPAQGEMDYIRSGRVTNAIMRNFEIPGGGAGRVLAILPKEYVDSQAPVSEQIKTRMKTGLVDMTNKGLPQTPASELI